MNGKKNALTWVFGFLSLALAVALAVTQLGTAAAGAGADTESMAFPSPEEAIGYFIDCVKNQDIDAALRACAIDEAARGYDFEAMANRLRIIQPVAMTYMPSDYPMYVVYNKSRITSQIMLQTIHFINSFSLPEQYSGLLEGVPTVVNPEDDVVQGVIAELDPALADMRIIQIGKHPMHDDEQNRKNQKAQAACYGADDMQFRAVLYQCGGEYFIGGFTLVQYGKKWLIFNLSDPLTGISAFGNVQKLSGQAEFGSMIQ